MYIYHTKKADPIYTPSQLPYQVVSSFSPSSYSVYQYSQIYNMDAHTHSNKRAPDNLHLKSRCPHVASATQTISEQLDTPQTRNSVQTSPIHVSEQQDVLPPTDDTVQAVSELPQLPLNSTEPEQIYNEIAEPEQFYNEIAEPEQFYNEIAEPEQIYNEIVDDAAARTATATVVEHRVQLPLRVTTHSPR
jgi:hypothetical protein